MNNIEVGCGAFPPKSPIKKTLQKNNPPRLLHQALGLFDASAS